MNGSTCELEGELAMSNAIMWNWLPRFHYFIEDDMVAIDVRLVSAEE